MSALRFKRFSKSHVLKDIGRQGEGERDRRVWERLRQEQTPKRRTGTVTRGGPYSI